MIYVPLKYWDYLHNAINWRWNSPPKVTCRKGEQYAEIEWPGGHSQPEIVAACEAFLAAGKPPPPPPPLAQRLKGILTDEEAEALGPLLENLVEKQRKRRMPL